MTVCGITAEYNPFHTGHLHHIAETRRSLGENAVIVCVMSGNFVQRGDFAVLDKYARAEMAVRCGADLVVELPLAAALSSAEGFAKGAVQTLHALGCGTVSFGAETADADLLLQAAELLNSLPMEGESGSPHLSYAAKRQEELAKVHKQAAALLDNPNNTLAVEYCRFLLPLGPTMHTRRTAALPRRVCCERICETAISRSAHRSCRLRLAPCGRRPQIAVKRRSLCRRTRCSRCCGRHSTKADCGPARQTALTSGCARRSIRHIRSRML